jgi:hypothetical protein
MERKNVPVSSRRTDFRELLERSKWSLKPSPSKKDSPNRLLAAAIKISPGRLAEFLDQDFFLTIIDNDGKLFEEDRIRRTVAGFTNSVAKTLTWLQRTGRLDPKQQSEITTRSVVQAYWPLDHQDKFGEPAVNAGISDGEKAADAKTAARHTIKIVMQTLDWGPFRSRNEADFFRAYGAALVAGVDPIDFEFDPQPTNLSEMLNLPASDPQKERVIAMGPSEQLYRKFQGMRFVTFPGFRVPLVALLVSTQDQSERLKFDDVLDSTHPIQRVVINREIGHLTLFSLWPREHRNRVKTLESGRFDEIPTRLLNLVRGTAHGRIVLLCDALIALETYAHISRSPATTVQVISQWTDDKTNFINRPYTFKSGIMLREQDTDLALLLEESQQQLFKDPNRVQKQLLAPLITGVRDWVDALNLLSDTAAKWEYAPILLYPQDEIEQYLHLVIADARLCAHHASAIGDWIEEKTGTSDMIRALFRVSRRREPQAAIPPIASGEKQP